MSARQLVVAGPSALEVSSVLERQGFTVLPAGTPERRLKQALKHSARLAIVEDRDLPELYAVKVLERWHCYLDGFLPRIDGSPGWTVHHTLAAMSWQDATALALSAPGAWRESFFVAGWKPRLGLVSRLEPCPFCTGAYPLQLSVRHTEKQRGSERVQFYVFCGSCAVEGPWAKSSASGAVLNWNRRPTC